MDDILGLGKAIDLVRDILAPVGTTAAEIWAGMLGDRVATWRVRNAMAYQPMLNSEASRLGLKLNPSRIPDRYAFAWFEEATKQDEPEIQILFARLLARAAAEEASAEAQDRRLIDILARLTPADASLFQKVYSDQPFPNAGTYSDHRGIGDDSEGSWSEEWMFGLLEKTHPGFSLSSIENLIVQGCLGRELQVRFSDGAIATPTPAYIAWGDEISKRLRARPSIRATALGRALYTATRE